MIGHIRRRGKHSYAAVVDADRGPDGKRDQRWISGKSRKGVEDRLAEFLSEQRHGIFIEPHKLTVSQYLEKWLNHNRAKVASKDLGRKTFERYQEIVEKHLIPALGKLPLIKLKPLHIQDSYSAALRGGRLDGRKGGLSAQTVLHHHRVLHRALAMAVKWELLYRNPADSVEAPSPESEEVRVIDEARAASLLECTKGTRLFIPILLAICTGARRGEILALRWLDVDLDVGFLWIRRALEETRDGVTFKKPKSRKGRRSISLPSIAVEYLNEHRKKQDERKRFLGAAYEDNDLICCCEDGRLWKPSLFSSAYQALLRRRGIPHINFHALRHSHASQLLRAGVSDKEISERLGHSKVGFTNDTYCHLLPGMQEEAARKVDVRLRSALEKTLPVM